MKDKRLPTLGIDRAGVQALLEGRDEARASKDWARADALRDELDGRDHSSSAAAEVW